VKIEQKELPFPLSKARRQLSALQPGPYSRNTEVEAEVCRVVPELVSVVIEELDDGEACELLEDRVDEAVLDETLLERLEEEELLDDKLLDDKLLDDKLLDDKLLDDKLLERLDEKLDERLLERLLERLDERLLEMELEQLRGQFGVGVIVGMVVDVSIDVEAGYAHEQTEDIWAATEHAGVANDGKPFVVKVVAVVNCEQKEAAARVLAFPLKALSQLIRSVSKDIIERCRTTYLLALQPGGEAVDSPTTLTTLRRTDRNSDIILELRILGEYYGIAKEIEGMDLPSTLYKRYSLPSSLPMLPKRMLTAR